MEEERAHDEASTAVLDEAHLGDIEGAFGTIRYNDIAPRPSLSGKLKTLLAIVGPGLIVMVGDNDAGAFGTYTQAGQNYGTHLLWTLLLLVPVLYVNQEMVLRLGAVSGVGHARLILERFGRFWGAFSVIDLFILNALTIVTEFIGISLAVTYLGLPKVPTVILAGLVVVGAVSTGSFRTFERISLTLAFASLLVVPIFVMAHPTLSQMSKGLFVPSFPEHQVATVMLLVIAIVGTTVAPWQLFFQQSYVIDKRITPRFINYERVDLVVGIVIVVVGAAAMMGFSAATFAGTPQAGHFTSAAGVAAGLARYVNPAAGVLFAVALIDASIIGASAVGLATAYAVADVLGLHHSLHRGVKTAKGFYASYAALILVSAVLVLTPGVPLGLLTEGVQTLAGVLLPSATVFLLLLCNDKAVLGPWVNSRGLNVFTSAVIWVLVLMSVILTAGVLFPNLTGAQIVLVLAGGCLLGAAVGIYLLVLGRRRAMPGGKEATASSTTAGAGEPAREGDRRPAAATGGREETEQWRRETWRMPSLSVLTRPTLTTQRKVGLMTLRGYLVVAFALVVVKIVEVAVK
jgi:NRAMP (natural resistance-associated macrophage protein)-like metal ion transporter